MAILTIASLTLREAARRKLLVIVGAITLVLIVLIAWGFSAIPSLCHNPGGCKPPEIRLGEAGLLILVAYMYSLMIAIAAPFIAAPAIASDVESNIVLAILPRPLTKSDLVVGRWLGLAILLAAYTGLTCGLEFFGVNLAVGYVVPHPVWTTLCIMGEAISLMTLTLLFSTRLSAMTSGIVAIVLFGITWIVGIAGQIGAAFNTAWLADIGTVSSLILPTDGFWRAALFNMEPVALLATSSSDPHAASIDPFNVPYGPTAAYLIWAIAWIFVVLGFSMWSFSRREL